MLGNTQYVRKYRVCQGIYSMLGNIEYVREYTIYQEIYSMLILFEKCSIKQNMGK